MPPFPHERQLAVKRALDGKFMIDARTATLIVRLLDVPEGGALILADVAAWKARLASEPTLARPRKGA
jgi:hypothetical protein